MVRYKRCRLIFKAEIKNVLKRSSISVSFFICHFGQSRRLYIESYLLTVRLTSFHRILLL